MKCSTGLTTVSSVAAPWRAVRRTSSTPSLLASVTGSRKSAACASAGRARHANASRNTMNESRPTGRATLPAKPISPLLSLVSLASALGGSRRASVLVDLDRLHHALLLVVHHVAMQHVDAGVIEEARAEDDIAPLARHHHRVAPLQVGLRPAVHLSHLERIGMDGEHMVVWLVAL